MGDDMKQKGFTLLELLGIIIILGLIILIAYPIVVEIISDSKIDSVTSSTYSYIRAVESTIAKDAMNHPGDTYTGTYQIQKKEIVNTSDHTKLLVVAKGTYPTGTLVIRNGVVKSATLKLDGFKLTYDGKKVKVD